MTAARLLLALLRRLEQAGTTLAFSLMVVVLGLDIFGREVAGGGRIWATPVAVYGMVFIAFIGIGVASAGGAHLRPRFMDGLTPKRFAAGFDRATDIGFALFSIGAAVLCLQMLQVTVELQEVDAVMQWPVWPFQTILVAAFGIAAVRHGLYAVYPALRPAEAGGENAAPTQDQVDELAAGDAASLLAQKPAGRP